MKAFVTLKLQHFYVLIGVILVAGGIVLASVYLPPWLLLSVTGLAALGVLFLKYPELLLYFMLAAAPFHFFVTRVLLNVPSLGEGSFSLGGLYQDLWPLALIVLWFMRGAISGSLKIKKSPVSWPIVLLMGWALLHLISVAPLTPALFGLRNLGRYAILPFLLPMVIREKEQVNRIFLAAFLGMSLAALVSMTEIPAFLRGLARAKVSLSFDLAALPADVRFVGIFSTEERSATQFSNTFSVALALMVTYGVAMLVSTKKRAFFVVGIALQTIYILLTLSRRGYFTLLLGPILMLLWWKKIRLSRVQLLLIGAVLLIVAVSFLLTTATGRLVVGRFIDRPFTNTSMSARQNDWRFLWDEATESPFRFIWGYGLASTGPVSVRFDLPKANPAHSYFLMILHEMGIIGLGLFLWLLWRVIRLGRRIIDRTSDKEIEQSALFCQVVVTLLIFNGFLGTTFEAFPLDLLFWTVVGVLVAMDPISGKRGENLQSDGR